MRKYPVCRIDRYPGRVHLRRIYRKLGIQGRSNLRDFNSL